MPAMPRRLVMLLVCLTALAMPALPFSARAAGPGQQITFENQDPVYLFGERLDFAGKIHSTAPIREAHLFIQSAGLPETIVLPVTVDEDGNATAALDLVSSPFRAFAELNYWYRVVTEDGQAQTSPQYTLRYADNRYNWQHLEGDQFTVFWYTGEVSFAQEVLNIAAASELNWRKTVNIPTPGKTGIYVYNSVEAMQAALLPAAQNWVAGHADPVLGVVLVSLPPGPEQHLEMERQVPHELMHISLYSALGPAYADLPAWLNEGLATMAELYPNPDNQALLENAYRSGQLQPFSALCRAFPAETDQALLAYAQSASLSRFIFEQYGPGVFEEILAYLLQGQGCQEAVEAALGTSLVQLESQWRQATFAEQAWRGALNSLLPWAAVLFVVITGPALLALGALRRKPEGMD